VKGTKRVSKIDTMMESHEKLLKVLRSAMERIDMLEEGIEVKRDGLTECMQT